MALKRFALGTTTTTVELGQVDQNRNGEWVIHVTGTLGSGTISPTGYAQGTPKSGNTTNDSTALTTANAVTLPYYFSVTGALTVGSTAINALGIYRIIVPAGVSVVLSYTAGGGSDLVVHARPALT